MAIGLDRFTIAEVATSLGVSDGALYRHVESRDRLWSRACDAVWAGMDLDDVATDPWQQYLTEVASRATALADEHPGLARYLTYGPYEPATLASFDRLISTVADGSGAMAAEQAYVVVSRVLHAALAYLSGDRALAAANRPAVAWHVRAVIDGMSSAISRGDLPPPVAWSAFRDAVRAPGPSGPSS